MGNVPSTTSDSATARWCIDPQQSQRALSCHHSRHWPVQGDGCVAVSQPWMHPSEVALPGT